MFLLNKNHTMQSCGSGVQYKKLLKNYSNSTPSELLATIINLPQVIPVAINYYTALRYGF